MVSARLDPEVLEQLTTEAQRRGVTRTDLLREAIARVLSGEVA
jgi:predicted DNA-binding protein